MLRINFRRGGVKDANERGSGRFQRPQREEPRFLGEVNLILIKVMSQLRVLVVLIQLVKLIVETLEIKARKGI